MSGEPKEADAEEITLFEADKDAQNTVDNAEYEGVREARRKSCKEKGGKLVKHKGCEGCIIDGKLAEFNDDNSLPGAAAAHKAQSSSEMSSNYNVSSDDSIDAQDSDFYNSQDTRETKRKKKRNRRVKKTARDKAKVEAEARKAPEEANSKAPEEANSKAPEEAEEVEEELYDDYDQFNTLSNQELASEQAAQGMGYHSGEHSASFDFGDSENLSDLKSRKFVVTKGDLDIIKLLRVLNEKLKNYDFYIRKKGVFLLTHNLMKKLTTLLESMHTALNELYLIGIPKIVKLKKSAVRKVVEVIRITGDDTESFQTLVKEIQMLITSIDDLTLRFTFKSNTITKLGSDDTPAVVKPKSAKISTSVTYSIEKVQELLQSPTYFKGTNKKIEALKQWCAGKIKEKIRKGLPLLEREVVDLFTDFEKQLASYKKVKRNQAEFVVALARTLSDTLKGSKEKNLEKCKELLVGPSEKLGTEKNSFKECVKKPPTRKRGGSGKPKKSKKNKKESTFQKFTRRFF